jgi:proton-dependent oligopeptide transporter, POT family
LAYTLPTAVFCICPIVLWAGRNKYVQTPPTGSVLSSATHIFRHCMRGRWNINPYTLYKTAGSDDFWENAKPSNVQGDKPNWMTFDDMWVGEVRRGFEACAVFCWLPLCCTSSLNLSNPFRKYIFLGRQGSPSDKQIIWCLKLP